ncbi:cell wall anchor protein, partial [Avibacterium volantium]
MARNITLKINSAKKTLETVNLKAGAGKVTTVSAQSKVNYQLIDDNTGFAPENIMIKRDGKDLKIAFEGSNIENPDLIISNYYDEEVGAYKDSLLVGAYENGEIYPYVPESTLQADAVTELDDQVSAGQALGGDPIGAFWAFNPLWLLALVPLFFLGAVKGGHSSGHNDTDTTAPDAPDVVAQDDGSVTVTPPTDDDTKEVETTYTDEDGNPHTVVTEKDDDGQWTVKNPDENPGVTVDPDTGVVTIPEDKVKDGTEVVSKGKDEAGNESPADKDTAKDVTPPGKPDVEAQDDGSVTVTPPTDDDTKEVETTYTDEDGNPHTVVTEKDDDGQWTVKNPDENPGVTVDPDTGVVTIPEDKVKDGTEVVSKGKDEAGNESPAD